MTIKSTIFCILISGLFCSFNVFGMKTREVIITEDQKVMTDITLSKVKAFTQHSDFSSKYKFSQSWTSLPITENVNIIEVLQEDHYKDIVMIFSEKDAFEDFKLVSKVDRGDIIEMLWVLYYDVKRRHLDDSALIINLTELNIRNIPLVLAANAKSVKKNQDLNTTIFRWQIFGGFSFTAAFGLFVWLFFLKQK